MDSFDIDKLVDKLNFDDNFHNYHVNDIYLSNYQISILERNNIKYKNYNNLKSLIFDIDYFLNNYGSEDEELDKLLDDLVEFNYYKNINK